MLGQVEEVGLGRSLPRGAAALLAAALASLRLLSSAVPFSAPFSAFLPEIPSRLAAETRRDVSSRSEGGRRSDRDVRRDVFGRLAGGRESTTLRSANLEAIRKEIASRRGSPLLVNFWAVWCAPCVEELPALAAIESRFAKSRIRVLGVTCDLLVEDDSPDLRARVAAVLKRARVSYANLLYEGREDPLLSGFDLPGPLPVSILYGADGAEMRRWTGTLPVNELEAALAGRG